MEAGVFLWGSIDGAEGSIDLMTEMTEEEFWNTGKDDSNSDDDEDMPMLMNTNEESAVESAENGVDKTNNDGDVNNNTSNNSINR